MEKKETVRVGEATVVLRRKHDDLGRFNEHELRFLRAAFGVDSGSSKAPVRDVAGVPNRPEGAA